MRSVRFLSALLLSSALALTLPLTAMAAGEMGSSSMGMDAPTARAKTPAEQAKVSYDSGVRTVKKADELMAEAASAPDDKKDKLTGKARKQYEKAREQFKEATERFPGFYEAWNYVGYTSRKLGEYDQSLAAYDQALKINPSYSQAIEYRGETYLALNRLEDAKAAYTALASSASPLANQLLTAMQKWVQKQRGNSEGVAPTDIDTFAQWVNERAGTAPGTAALGPDAPEAESGY